MKTTNLLLLGALVAAVPVAFAGGCGSDDPATGGGGGGGSAGFGANAGTAGVAPEGGFDVVVFDTGPTGDVVVGDGFDPDAACAGEEVTADAVPANILFVIDRTGSMNCNPPPIQTTAQCLVTPQKIDPAQPSKWEITRTALTDAITGLEATDPLPSIGIMYFNNDDRCGFPEQPDVPVGPLSGNAGNDPQLNALVLSLGAVVPKGDTPIVAAMSRAYLYFDAHAGDFNGNRFVVLLTDGAESCLGDKGWLVSAAGAARSIGIRTFVLGAPGSEDERAFLSQIAFEGGTALDAGCDHSGSAPDVGDCHMDMTVSSNFAADLRSNLEAISREALACEFDVPPPPQGQTLDKGKVNVVYTHGDGTSERIPQDPSDCSDPSNLGWQYTDNDTKIVLCAGACDAVKNDPGASISIEFGCTTIMPPR